MSELRVLGSVDLRDDRGLTAGEVLAQPKRLALLAYLSLARPRGFQRTDPLLALFWPELDSLHARAALRQSVYFLRRHLGSESLISRGRGEELAGMWHAWAAGDRAAAAAAITDEVVDALVVHGPADRCREHITRYAAAGVTTPVLALLPSAGGPPPAEQIRALAPLNR